MVCWGNSYGINKMLGLFFSCKIMVGEQNPALGGIYYWNSYSKCTTIAQDHAFFAQMIERAIDLHYACRITPTNHGFSVMLSSL